jgi:XTP/dITP diphosphohydrolase
MTAAATQAPATLVVATRNVHKLAEIRAMLAGDRLAVLGLADVAAVPEVIEDGDTFAANAVKKARTVAVTLGAWALADDSGLEVEALDGEPGVRSARYAGEGADDRARNALLLARLDAHPNRTACFRCAIALSDPAGRTATVEGVCRGRILPAGRGQNGFGYDPLFVPDGFDRTFAEFEAHDKHRISHRGQALARARAAWWRNGRLTLPADAPAVRHS